MDSSTVTHWTGPFPTERCPANVYYHVLKKFLYQLQTRSAASDLSLHCLPRSLLWDARLKYVNFKDVLYILRRNLPIKRNLIIVHCCDGNLNGSIYWNQKE